MSADLFFGTNKIPSKFISSNSLGLIANEEFFLLTLRAELGAIVKETNDNDIKNDAKFFIAMINIKLKNYASANNILFNLAKEKPFKRRYAVNLLYAELIIDHKYTPPPLTRQKAIEIVASYWLN
jgi:hypothetical protein